MNEECGINWDEQEKISWEDAEEKIDNRTLLIVNLPDQEYMPYFIEVDHVERHGDVIKVYDKFVYDVDLSHPETCMPPFHIDGEHYDFTKEEWEGNVFRGGCEIEDAVYSAASEQEEGEYDEREEGEYDDQGKEIKELREEAEFWRCCAFTAEKEKEDLEIEMLQEAADRRRREYLDQTHGKYSGYGTDSFMCYMSDYD